MAFKLRSVPANVKEKRIKTVSEHDFSIFKKHFALQVLNPLTFDLFQQSVSWRQSNGQFANLLRNCFLQLLVVTKVVNFNPSHNCFQFDLTTGYK